MNFTQPYDSVQLPEDNEGSMHVLYEGAALAVLVVRRFLRDWRTTLVSVAAPPQSIILTIAAMHFMVFLLNTVTLLTLTLVIGISSARWP